MSQPATLSSEMIPYAGAYSVVVGSMLAPNGGVVQGTSGIIDRYDWLSPLAIVLEP